MTHRAELRRAGRNLLVEAIARYRSTLAASERLEQLYADPENPPADDAERVARERLRGVADNSWDMAESALAEAISQLQRVMAPPGRRSSDDAGPYHVGFGVKHRGWTYILTEPVDQFSTRHRVITAFRDELVVGLARGSRKRGR